MFWDTSRIRLYGTTSLPVYFTQHFPHSLESFLNKMMAPKTLNFRIPQIVEELVSYIGIDQELFENVTNPDTQKDYFYMHEIPKKGISNEYRTVWEVNHGTLPDIYKGLNRRLDLFFRSVDAEFPHRASFGYMRGRNIAENAAIHTGNKYLFRTDISEFFPTISRLRIKAELVTLGMNETCSELLSRFLTIGDSLPLGVNTSPLIANLVCRELDKKLYALSLEMGCQYSRYADDIAFSSTKEPPDHARIIECIESEKFQVSERKTRHSCIGQAHYVTGLSISDTKYPRIPKSIKKKLRQELYYCQKFGIVGHLMKLGTDEFIHNGVNRIDGMVKYVSHIEPELDREIRELWSALMERDNQAPSFPTMQVRHNTTQLFFADETEFSAHGEDYLAICFSVINQEDFELVNSLTQRTLRRHIADPFADGSKEKLEKFKLHYVDATQDLRKAYIDRLCTMPIKTYVAFTSLEKHDTYSDAYIYLLNSLLRRRMMAAAGAKMSIVFEQNSKIKTKAIEDTVNNIFRELRAANNRCPYDISIEIGEKSEHPCFSIPDFFLGVFRTYAMLHGQKHPERPTNFFEKLRDKMRVILDTDQNIIYSRKRQFFPIKE